MQLNPTVAEIAEAAKAYEGKGRKEVTEALKHRIGEIEAVHEQLTDGYDWSKATKLDGEDKATKRANFRKMNADLAALRERMSEIQGIDRSVDAKDRAAEIAARNGGSRPSAEAQGQAVTAIQRVDTHKLARDQRMTFLRAAAEKAGLDVASAGYGHDSLIYKLAHNRDGGASKVEISLDDMLGPQGPVNVLTSADAGGAGGGFSIYPPMTDRVVEGIFPPRRVIDILPRERTTSNQYRYMARIDQYDRVLTATTGNAAAQSQARGWRNENEAGQEIAPKWEQKGVDVKKISAYFEVTEEQVEDGMDVDGRATTVLINEVRTNLEEVVMIGTGADKQPSGLFGATGFTAVAQPDAAANKPTYGLDSISLACFTIMKDVWEMPDFIVMHPLDWHEITTARDDDGNLQFMHPTEAALMRILGIPVILSPFTAPNAAQGNVCLGSFRMNAALVDRRDLTIARTNVHDANFTKDVITIKGSVRAAVARFRDKAFAKVTSFNGKKSQ